MAVIFHLNLLYKKINSSFYFRFNVTSCNFFCLCDMWVLLFLQFFFRNFFKFPEIWKKNLATLVYVNAQSHKMPACMPEWPLHVITLSISLVLLKLKKKKKKFPAKICIVKYEKITWSLAMRTDFWHGFLQEKNLDTFEFKFNIYFYFLCNFVFLFSLKN